MRYLTARRCAFPVHSLPRRSTRPKGPSCLNSCLQPARRYQSPSLANMISQIFIADAVNLDTDPATDTNVRRFEECLRRGLDEHYLETGRGRYPHRNMPVVVVIVGKHGEDLFTHEEGRFTMREFFGSLRHGRADSPHSSEMLLIDIRLSFLCHSFQLTFLVLHRQPDSTWHLRFWIREHAKSIADHVSGCPKERCRGNMSGYGSQSGSCSMVVIQMLPDSSS